ncbi:MAG: hypothetical protein IKY84_01770 [Bacteroidaceae bacterium]|nr:hypothetical protein [Bacteroidaceae bacterium]
MNSKRYFFITLGCILLSLLMIVGVVVIVDPYQQYKQSDVFMSNQRLSNPGIAKTQDYDAVIVGSSMAMNHYPSQVDSLFGWNTINMTVKGGVDADYNLLFPHIARQGKVKHMIWGLDFFSFTLPTTYSLEPYLYDNKWWNDYPYWVNYTSCTNLFNKLTKRKIVTSRDEVYHFNSSCGKELLLKYYMRDNNEKYFGRYDFSRMEVRFDEMLETVMPLLQDKDMYIYFSPYSIFEFKMLEQYGHWKQVLDFKQYMIEKLLKYPNVKLYDFQKEEFICNLNEYMDLRHHSHAYNKRIIECMYKDSCRITEDNYKKDLAALDSLIKHYRLND